MKDAKYIESWWSMAFLHRARSAGFSVAGLREGGFDAS